MTYAAKKWREVPAKDYLLSRAHLIHHALVIAPPNTPLGKFSLAFLQNASEETLRTIYDECEFQGSKRVSLTFCCKNSSTSHAKHELDDKTIGEFNHCNSGTVHRYGSPELEHDTTYYYVSVEL